MRPQVAGPCREPCYARRERHGDGGKAQDHQGRDQQGQHRHHDLLAFDLLAQVLRRPPHHQPGDEDRDDGEHDHAVQPCADPSKDDLTERDVGDQHQPSQRRIAIVEAHDGARRGGRRGHFLERRDGDAVPHLLPLHVAARLGSADLLVRADAGQDGIAGLLGGNDDRQADHEQDGRDNPQHPALARIAHPLAEHVEQARTQRNLTQDDQHGREGVGVLEGMRRVDVEEAAAVGPQVLDDLHRGHRPLGDGLRLPVQGMHDRVGVEVLDHALRDEDQRAHDADGQQEVERAARQVHPEVAQVLRAAAREPAHQRHRQRDAGSGGDELVKGQPGHLRQIGHGLLAGIVLPVGVGREAGCRVESQLRLDIGQALRIEERSLPLLGALERIQEQHAHHAEDQHRDHVARPLLLLLLVHATEPVEKALDGDKDRREPGALPVEDLVHIEAERLGQQQHDDQKDQHLQDTVECYRHSFLPHFFT